MEKKTAIQKLNTEKEKMQKGRLTKEELERCNKELEYYRKTGKTIAPTEDPPLDFDNLFPDKKE
ncbi:MAG: hypothetical protein IPG18_07745 [Saprospiraceae bacterium]|nr:hypothetical protein [Saprospiraceae bacterium]